MKVALRPRAQADLAGIWDYTVDRWGLDQAEAYLQLLRSVIEGLGSAHRRSSDSGHLHPGLRRVRAGSHLVYFLVGEAVDVVRILHQRQDPDSNV